MLDVTSKNFTEFDQYANFFQILINRIINVMTFSEENESDIRIQLSPEFCSDENQKYAIAGYVEKHLDMHDSLGDFCSIAISQIDDKWYLLVVFNQNEYELEQLKQATEEEYQQSQNRLKKLSTSEKIDYLTEKILNDIQEYIESGDTSDIACMLSVGFNKEGKKIGDAVIKNVDAALLLAAQKGFKGIGFFPKLEPSSDEGEYFLEIAIKIPSNNNEKTYIVPQSE